MVEYQQMGKSLTGGTFTPYLLADDDSIVIDVLFAATNDGVIVEVVTALERVD
jgi:hypothetical protein